MEIIFYLKRTKFHVVSWQKKVNSWKTFFFHSTWHMKKTILNLENGALKKKKKLSLAGRPLKNGSKSLEVKRSQNKLKKSYLPPCLKLDHTLRGTIIPCGYFYLICTLWFFCSGSGLNARLIVCWLLTSYVMDSSESAIDPLIQLSAREWINVF